MLEAGKTHNITLYYPDPEMTKPNWAWLPTGSYLRIQKSCFALPSGDLGVRINTPSEFKPFVGLPLILQPSNWSAKSGAVSVSGFESDHSEFQTVPRLAKRNGI